MWGGRGRRDSWTYGLGEGGRSQKVNSEAAGRQSRSEARRHSVYDTIELFCDLTPFSRDIVPLTKKTAPKKERFFF